MARRTSTRPQGRPTLLSEEVHKRLVQATVGGAPMWAAAEYAGIVCRTFEKWLARGYEEDSRLQDEAEEPDEDEAPYRQLFLDMQRARGEATTSHVLNIRRAAMGGLVTEETTKRYRDESGRLVEETTVKKTPPDWRASAWWLERRDATNFGKNAELSLEVSGPGGGPVQISGEEAKGLAEKVRGNILALTAAAATAEEAAGDDVTDAEVVDED